MEMLLFDRKSTSVSNNILRVRVKCYSLSFGIYVGKTARDCNEIISLTTTMAKTQKQVQKFWSAKCQMSK
jgi:hypothetical protein